MAVNKCFSAGSVTAPEADYVSGFCPFNNVLTNDCYYDHDVAQLDDDYATPKTTAEMKTQSTFTSWDFNMNWKIGAFVAGDTKKQTDENGEYSLRVKAKTINVFVEYDPSDGYPFLQCETKKEIDASSVGTCNFYVRGRMPALPSLYSWGSNLYGNLGVGVFDEENYPEPTLIGAGNWDLLSGGESYSFASYGGGLYSCGDGWGGCLGLGDTDSRSVFITTGETGYKTILATVYCTFGIKNDGTLWGCGYNEYDMLVQGSPSWPYVEENFVLIDSGEWAKIACMYQHVLGIKKDGTLWAWGLNNRGQLGLGHTTYRIYTPTQVGSDNNWMDVGCHYYSTIALKSDGTLWGWGWDRFGEAGLGGGIEVHVPTAADTGDSRWKSLATGPYITGLIRTDDTLWTMGSGWLGALGIDGETLLEAPTQVGTDTWKQVSFGDTHAAGIKSDGTLWTWGGNYCGQLGWGTVDDDYYEHYVPIQVGADVWKKVDCGYDFTLAIK